jgi:hypothetical protein
MRGALRGRAEMRRMPTVLSSCRTRRTLSTLRRAGGPGRPAAGVRLILTSATTTRTTSTPPPSLRLTAPETGRGQASLWTAAAAPDHRLWTTLRGPVDPSRLPPCPLPRRLGRNSSCASITANRKEKRSDPNLWSADTASEHQQPLTGGPYLSIEVGRSGLSKPQVTMLAVVDLEERVPRTHPLRVIKQFADRALAELSPLFDEICWSPASTRPRSPRTASGCSSTRSRSASSTKWCVRLPAWGC